MSLDDILSKFGVEEPELTESQIWKTRILELFKTAAFNLFLSGLKEPYIYNFADKNDPTVKALPENIQYQMDTGFSIDLRTWRTFFDLDSIPKHLEGEEVLSFSEGIFEHEFMHYIVYPRSKKREAQQMAAIQESYTLDAFTESSQVSKMYSGIINNIFGDILLELYLTHGYGRDPTATRRRAVKRYQDIVIDVAKQPGVNKSPLWNCMVASLEELFGADLGFKKRFSLNKDEKEITKRIVNIFGDDWRDESTWIDKLKEFTKTIETVLLQSIPLPDVYTLIDCMNSKDSGKCDKSTISDKGEESADGKGGKKGKHQAIPDIPSEITKTWGDIFSSPLGNNTSDIQGQIDALKHLNPRQFAGAMGMLRGEDPTDALRFLYRARAEELLIQLKPEEKMGHQQTIRTKKNWEPTDPITGREGLRIEESLLEHGKVIPYVNTRRMKLRRLPSVHPGISISDLILVVDSSGSMGFDPMNHNPKKRGRFDKAVLAGESCARYSLSKGARVAVINFGGKGDVKTCSFTDNLDNIERTLLYRAKSGTKFPCDELALMMHATKNRRYVAILSDCELFNEEDAIQKVIGMTSEYDRFCVFQTKTGNLTHFAQALKDAGATVIPVQRNDDLYNIVMGETIREYNPEYDVPEWD